MKFFKSIFFIAATFKLGSFIGRKVVYKYFLRQSIYKNGMKVASIIFILIELIEFFISSNRSKINEITKVTN
jgi:hypothetical protein